MAEPCLAACHRVPFPDSKMTIRRVHTHGRFLLHGSEKLHFCGVTYGPFGALGSEGEYHNRKCVQRDFAQMHLANINAIRTYTAPPMWLLDCAEEHGLRVMVGTAWEQHVTFLDDAKLSCRIAQRIGSAVKELAGHPAVLCYSIGNEIPASIVRWHGRRRVETFLRELYWRAKDADPEGLVTYVNYPSTEYLQLPFLDFVCFNVYLQSNERLAAYLARLVNLAGERPLVMGEIGLDSRRNGEQAQARLLQQQIRIASEAGCAGTFVYSWTDEWHRGGVEIHDWDFGLTRRDRTAKPALAAVAKMYAEVSRGPEAQWPRVSVVVCTYNGCRHLADTLSALERLDYPDYEVIVVDDGSTDATSEIAAQYDVRLIRTGNRGLSSARNTGLHAASGEIVAYIDDDAYPDSEWLKRLAMVFLNSDYAGVGGPNLPPAGDSLVAECVAHAPGGPIHVLLSDTEAEHIPGCNMAFRRTHLAAIGGFDPQFRAAGDDVDVCWRIQQQGWKLGFSPTATVFHHRRGSLRAYWKQQVGYGKAEALLERKWPDKYNAVGHLTWVGRVYDARGATPLWWCRDRIYQGTWGTAPYQRLYQPAATLLGDLPLLPEWYLIVAFFGLLSLIGVTWRPLLAAIPLFLFAAGSSLLQAAVNAAIASSCIISKVRGTEWKAFAIGMILHLMHPLARLYGRLKYGLHPWRQRGAPHISMPRSHNLSVWTEEWRSPENWLRDVHMRVRSGGTAVSSGGDYDDWDLQVEGGILGGVRTLMAVEEHGGRFQMLRFKIWPRCSSRGLFTCALLASLAIAAAWDHAWTAAAVLGGISLMAGRRLLHECTAAMHKLGEAVKNVHSPTGTTAPLIATAEGSQRVEVDVVHDLP
jgi:GT2 family glycosyltransferase/membrane protein implicated in regulation of membrane protease activity